MRSHAARITLAAMLLLGRAEAFFAVPSLVVDPSDVGVTPGRFGPNGATPGGINPGGANPGDVTTAPDAPASDRSAAGSVPTGNPLWAIPLKQLSETRDRPIFTPSRRPPPPTVIAPYIAPVPPPVITRSEPERPNLALVGMVVSEHEGIGVFVEQNTNNIIRLRMGEAHTGWILRHLEGREATLEKGRQTATLAMPSSGSDGAKNVMPIDVGRANR
jgi:general secretion pathway protein N